MILPPNPGRLIEGLRDTGYDFNTALADIVDNSVDAQASKVLIRIQMDAFGETTITIADNGIGMNEPDLENAMTYGAKSKQVKSRLGKFGLGLKNSFDSLLSSAISHQPWRRRRNREKTHMGPRSCGECR